ncbi:MAG: DUF169 domain-containing protein [Bacteroidales bacterium]|jgi:uncharacterized protein (DUF169 family)|nr:DUF169 domain-containing protein [Bacteroidales bacterium]
MNLELRDTFILLWKKYFGDSELPVTFYYSYSDGSVQFAEKPKGWSCIVCELAKVRNGISLVYNAERITCGGARRYLGYSDKMRPGFEHFLSCGNGKTEGERYLRTPELVREFMKAQRILPVSGMNIVFKRWDKLEEADEPDVVIFFATPDVLSGLFTLANFDQSEPNGTIAPFGSGCASIIHFPFLEGLAERQRAVIGMFDPSARKCVPENVLTFALPMRRFEKMISYMEESFLITDTWTVVRKRL